MQIQHLGAELFLEMALNQISHLGELREDQRAVTQRQTSSSISFRRASLPLRPSMPDLSFRNWAG